MWNVCRGTWLRAAKQQVLHVACQPELGRHATCQPVKPVQRSGQPAYGAGCCFRLLRQEAAGQAKNRARRGARGGGREALPPPR